jgi:long-chain-fatty-acid---luciferin-component ligase
LNVVLKQLKFYYSIQSEEIYMALAELRRKLQILAPPREQWTAVDQALYGPEDLYRVDSGTAEQLRFQAIKVSFDHHFKNNGFYQRYCRQEGVTPFDIQRPEDLVRIPLISDIFFKDYPTGVDFYHWLQKIASIKLPEVRFRKRNPSFDEVIEALSEHDVTVTFTSGSSGRYSFFPRDALTWMRQRYSFACSGIELIRSEYETADPTFFRLNAFPNPTKTFLFSGKIAIATYGTVFDQENVEYLIDRKVTTDTLRIAMGRGRGFKENLLGRLAKIGRKKMVADFGRKIETYAGSGKKLVIAAPPFLVSALLSTLEDQGRKLQLGKNVWLGTAGGWKIPTGGVLLDKNWRARIVHLLGIPEDQIRDVYGMSECSAFFPDCEGHYKHIPQSIVYPLVVDEELRPLDYGYFGRLALLDPLPNSYPGFIITSDRVKILKSCPICDRPGPVFDNDISRIIGAEDRGCAAIAREQMILEKEKNFRPRSFSLG